MERIKEIIKAIDDELIETDKQYLLFGQANKILVQKKIYPLKKTQINYTAYPQQASWGFRNWINDLYLSYTIIYQMNIEHLIKIYLLKAMNLHNGDKQLKQITLGMT